MTKAQALAVMNALESVGMPASAVMTFANGVEQPWTVQLDASHVYSGAQLGQLATYCANNNLTLSAQFTALGIT